MKGGDYTNQQIRKLRKELDLTQQEFAERIGVSRANIGKYETGISEPSAAVLSLICHEFDIREEWLRTGEGEMFKPKPSDILDQLAYKYQFSNADYAIVEKFISLNPSKRKEMVENVFGLLHEIEAALNETEPYAPAYARNEPPQPMDRIVESMKANQKETSAPEMSVEQAEAEYIKRISEIARKEGSIALNTINGKKAKEA